MSSSRAAGGPQPWWANQGHNRAMAERAAQLAKQRKKWSLAGCALISWMLVYIAGASIFMFGRGDSAGDDASSVQAIGTKRHLAKSCRFYGPADGYLLGCVQDCIGFARLAPALHACAADVACSGVTYVPWEQEQRRFELRGGKMPVGPRMTPDGQVSFVVETCEDGRPGWNPDAPPKPIKSSQRAKRLSQDLSAGLVDAAGGAVAAANADQGAKNRRKSGLRQVNPNDAQPNHVEGGSALAALEARLEEEAGAVRSDLTPGGENQEEEEEEEEDASFDKDAVEDAEIRDDDVEKEDEKHVKDADATGAAVASPRDIDSGNDKGRAQGTEDDDDHGNAENVEDEEEDDEEDEEEDEDEEEEERNKEDEGEKDDDSKVETPEPHVEVQGPASDPFKEPFGDALGPHVIAERPEDSADFEVKLWTPPGVDLDDDAAVDAVGSYEDGKPTIFVGIASYRDSMCGDTLERALHWATYPERLRFGVAEQNAPIDEHCFHVKRPCAEDPEQLLCKYRANIRIHKVSALEARGPTFGRFRADSLYRGEYYALQVDAHMYFVKGWDEDMVSQFESTGNEYAVLSTYPSDAVRQNFDEETAKSLSKTTPAICDSRFIGERQMTKHNAAQEFYPPHDIPTPILQIWWAAGVSFSRGHRILRVPYDCCLPMVFDGEETSMAFRAWTHGYDFYTFHHSAVFHPYNRKNRPPLYWENQKVDGSARARDLVMSERRLRKIYGLETKGPYFDKDIERFGLGKRRPLVKFWKVFGVDFRKNRIRNQCRPATSGAIHRVLTPFLRPDGKGIDYTKVRDDMNFVKAGKRQRKDRDK